jgi:hypothetical protein
MLRNNQVQILALFENAQNKWLALISPVSKTFADYTDRFPYFKGLGLGMFLETDNTPINLSADIITEWEFDILNTALMSREIQPLFNNNSKYTTRAIMIWWQLSLDPITRWKKECPQYYIPVPWNKDLGQPGFCIGKYEASSSDWTDDWVYNSKPNETAIISVESHSGYQNCKWNWDNYHIMTIMEWLTIARNIEDTWSNWSGSEVWSGHIRGWNNSDIVTWFDLWGTKLVWWPNWTSTPSQDILRQLTLSNGEIVWDFIGNVAELVKGLNNYTLDKSGDWELTISKSPVSVFSTALDLTWIDWIASNDFWYKNWEDITDTHFKAMYGPKSWATTSQWIWSIRQFSQRIFAVGWYAISSNIGTQWTQGLFSIIRLDNTSSLQIWTRCAYSY